MVQPPVAGVGAVAHLGRLPVRASSSFPAGTQRAVVMPGAHKVSNISSDLFGEYQG